MKSYILKLTITFFISQIFIFHNALSQSSLSARLTSLSINPFDTINNDIYKNKITPNGLFTIEPGINFAVELYGNDVTSAKLSQTVRLDACSKIAASTQLLLRFRLMKKWKNTITAGIGPILFYRRTWTTVDNYENEIFYIQKSQNQHSVMWLSGEIEYNLYLSKHSDLSISINHLSPRSFGILFGLKYWISRKSSKCNTCPSYR